MRQWSSETQRRQTRRGNRETLSHSSQRSPGVQDPPSTLAATQNPNWGQFWFCHGGSRRSENAPVWADSPIYSSIVPRPSHA